jgi:hypothetical protein
MNTKLATSEVPGVGRIARGARPERTAMLLNERRRAVLTSGRRRLRRPRQRYEDLYLAAALCRSERRFVAPGEEPDSTATARILSVNAAANLELELARIGESLTEVQRWLSPAARAAAEAKANARFVTIARSIRRRLAPSDPAPSSTPPKPSASETPAEPAARRCTATTQKGDRCKNRVREGEVCRVHAQSVAGKLPEAGPTASQTPASGVEPGPSARPFNPRRVVGARFAWPVTGVVIVGVAFALIWTGLSDDTADGGVGSAVTLEPVTDRGAAPNALTRSASRTSAYEAPARSGGENRPTTSGVSPTSSQSDGPGVGAVGDPSPGAPSQAAIATTQEAASPTPPPGPSSTPEASSPPPAPPPGPGPQPAPAATPPPAGPEAPSGSPSPVTAVGDLVDGVLPRASSLIEDVGG